MSTLVRCKTLTLFRLKIARSGSICNTGSYPGWETLVFVRQAATQVALIRSLRDAIDFVANLRGLLVAGMSSSSGARICSKGTSRGAGRVPFTLE